jgi:hypothetical protein
MKKSTLTLVAAVLACLTSPARAQSPALPPIAIVDCHLVTNTYYIFGRSDVPYVVIRGLSIAFVVRDQRSVSEVHFRANYRGEEATITDVGSFASGVKVVHQYDQFVNFAYLGIHPNVCRAIFARFADGTTWTAPVARRQASS